MSVVLRASIFDWETCGRIATAENAAERRNSATVAVAPYDDRLDAPLKPFGPAVIGGAIICRA